MTKHLDVRKRNGNIVSWDRARIERAVALAYYGQKFPGGVNQYRDSAVNCYGLDTDTYSRKVVGISKRVEQIVFHKYSNQIPSIEDVQNVVEMCIAGEGDWDVAKAYVIYRLRKGDTRLKEQDPTSLQDFIAVDKYSRYRQDLERRETWSEAVTRVRDMHLRRFHGKGIDDEIVHAFEGVEKRQFLPSMRSLQFGGAAIEACEARQYNCSYSYADRISFFKEAFYLLLCGTGVGFSVQTHHIAKLPPIPQRKNDVDLSVSHFHIEDSIAGWADAVDALIESYYNGKYVEFDYSSVRPRGAPIRTGGGKAPGHLPLRRCLENVRKIMDQAVGRRLKPIEVYDAVMYISEAVLSGGVRRSATICLFSPGDDEMRLAKTGDWYAKNPQRQFSNNSAVLLRNEATKPQFVNLVHAAKEYGDPGFYFTDSLDYGANPCVEIGLCPRVEVNASNIDDLEKRGISAEIGDVFTGWQMCNLTTINGAKAVTPEDFYRACYGASFIGTLQADYTNIPYLGPVTRYLNEREALIGVSICGIMDNPSVLLNPGVLEHGAAVVRETNAKIAKIIGINPAMRTTCVKPEGTASLLLGAASGIHPHHARHYFRRVFVNRMDPVFQHFALLNSNMVEASKSKPDVDSVITFPISAPSGAIVRADMNAIDFLRNVQLVQHSWVIPGARHDALHPGLNHNVSNTVNVRPEEWEDVINFIWDNRNDFTGVALLGYFGDKEFVQAPREEVVSDADVAHWNSLSYSRVDYASMYEKGDNTELRQTVACAGGACELT